MSSNTYKVTEFKPRQYVTSIISLILGLIIAFPVFYTFMAGFKSEATFDNYPPTIFPDTFAYLDNYKQVLFDSMVPRFMLNSLIIALAGVFIRLLFSTLAAYAFAFFEFPGKKFMFFFILGTMMIPPEALLITNFLTVTQLGLLDTYMGIMVVYFVSATQVFMFRQHFKTIASSLREAAYLDGCGELQFYFNICIPVSRPIITALGISSFINIWNTYLWPLLITNKPQMRTVQVGITMLTAEDPNKGLLFAAIAIILLPTFLLFAFSQRNMVHGISSGAIKG